MIEAVLQADGVVSLRIKTVCGNNVLFQERKCQSCAKDVADMIRIEDEFKAKFDREKT